MSNRIELKRARDRADYANDLVVAIEHLPRRIGQCVQWSNGVIWERAGDDQWRGWHFDKDDGVWSSDDDAYGFYSSEHVATSAGTWNPVEPVAKPACESSGPNGENHG